MGDGIKFLIDLDSRTKGATDAIQGLHGVENAAGKANEQIKSMGSSGKGLSRDVFNAEFAVHALEHAWNGAKWAAEKVRDIIKDTIGAVAGAERSKMALTNLLGEGMAAGALKDLEKFSQLSEFSKRESESFGISLMKAGYRGQDFADALAAVADAASLSADKTEGAQSALASLTRMKLTGKLDSRSLKGLGLDARDVIKDIGKSLGMDPGVVKKGLEQGAIPAAAAYGAVLHALERKTGKELGAAGMAAGGTLSAKLTHLAELPERIMTRLEGSPAMERIKERFDKMLSGLDPDSPKGQKIVGGLEHLMDTIASVDFDPLITGLAGVPALLGTWIEPLSKMVALMGKAAGIILMLPTVGEDLGDWVYRKTHPGADQTPGYVTKAREKAREEAGLPDLAEHVRANQAFLDKPFVLPSERAALATSGGAMDKPLSLAGMTAAAGAGVSTGHAIAAGAALPAMPKNINTTVSSLTTVNMTAHIQVDGSKDPEETAKQIGQQLGHHVSKAMEKQAVRSGVRAPRSTLGDGQ